MNAEVAASITTTGTSSTALNGYATHEACVRTQADKSESQEKLLFVAVAVLEQAIELVQNSLSNDEQLTTVSKYIPGSTIGKHLRHALDHFSLLIDSVDSSPSKPTANGHQASTDSNAELLNLNYDVRARGTPMEGSRPAACEAIERTISRLRQTVGTEYSEPQMDRPVRLEAVTPHLQVLQSSFGRELWFASLHAVHHWSMVRVICGELGIELDDSFGVAPSTLVYRGSEGPLGKIKI